MPDNAAMDPSKRPDDGLLASVIIPVLDDLPGLRRCIDALRAQSVALDQFEVIVVDNGLADGAGDRLVAIDGILTGLKGRALHQPQRGSYAARNTALAAARAPVVAFTDADCLPEPGWLEAGLAHLRIQPGAHAVAGRIELFAADETAPTGAELYELVHGFPQERYVTMLHFGATANLFVRREAFDRVGSFDAELKSGGDAEWGRRLHRNGLRMTYEPQAIVRHPARRSLRALRHKLERVTEGVADLRTRSALSSLDWARYVVKPLVPPVNTLRRAWRDPRLATRSDFVRYTATLLTLRVLTTRARITESLRSRPASASPHE